MMDLSQSMSETKTLNIGIIGDYQSGKSLLVNCLLERYVSTVGDGNATTHTIIQYRFSQKEYVEYYINGEGRKEAITVLNKLDNNPCIERIEVYANSAFLKNYVLIDMPGLDYDTNDNKKSVSFFKTLDYAIVVSKNVHAISNYYSAIRLLKQYGIPYYFIINCTTLYDDSRWDPNHGDNLSIAKSDMEYLEFYKPLVYPFDNKEIPIVNLMWYWLSLKDVNSDELLKKYEKNFKAYDLLEPGVLKTDIENESNFNLIKKIFSMDNKLYLELRKDFKEEIQKLKEELCPVGTIQAFAFPNIPVGWLACNGQSVEIAAYPELYHAIGITFGGDGETIFALPDLRNRFVRGWDENLSTRKLGSLQEDAMQGHGHLLDSFDTKRAGGHTHQVHYENYSAGTWGEKKRIPAVATYYYSYSDNPLGMDQGTTNNGEHTHTIESKKILKMIADKDGEVRSSFETRPKNMALLYCIKAENLCSADTSTKSGYSTIVEKVKKEMAPLCETLPVVEIGGGEYLVNIESIKESHFCNHPNCRQELVYLTAKCFKDICFYNSRLGLREEGFDEFGLDLLVSWMIDKEMVEKEEKLLFIDEVKHYITSFLSNVSPMQ